jgi:putative ABC transport system permease protein
MSLALATLVYEWRRYVAAVIALAFSGLLIFAQVGMFTGIVHSVTATIERSRAQIVIMPPKMEGLIGSGPANLPARIAPMIYLNPEVTEVASVDGAGGAWSTVPAPGQKKVTQYVAMRMVDPRAGAVTLPVDYSEATRIALMEPFAVAIDRSALGRLGVKLGDRAVLAGHTVHVAALLEGYGDLNQVTVVMSRDTMRMLGAAGRDGSTGPLMVALDNPLRVLEVREQLNAASGGAYRAWTREELAAANEKALLKQQIVGVILGFSAVLGFLIGVGVTSQTLRGAILANIREFASLRALGVSMGSLQLVVVEMSFWVGLAGLGLAGAATWLVSMVAAKYGVSMIFPPAWISVIACVLLVIAFASGALSMGVLRKSQPADLLR